MLNSDPNSPMVRLQHISKIYRRGEVEVPALRDLDLEVGQEEFLVILGPSGSGKTTLLNLIGGIDTPTEGNIIVGGVEITRFNEHRLTEYRRRKVGFIFQFFNLIPTLTARENIEFAAELVFKDGDQIQERTEALLGLVGLGERANHFPSQLSGGEQQRIAIARALVKDPPLMLCDEPTGELDSKTGRQVLQVMRELNRREGKTFIVVTHNAVIGRMADRVIQLRDGRIDEVVENSHPVEAEALEW
ncbi:MAG: ABC transporter ATP-binding protein [Candidatus Bipolaricaulia bacterium]